MNRMAQFIGAVGATILVLLLVTFLSSILIWGIRTMWGL